MDDKNISSNETVSVSFGKQFQELMVKIIGLEADVETLFQNQAKMLAILEERDSQEVLNEMTAYRGEIYNDIAAKAFSLIRLQ